VSHAIAFKTCPLCGARWADYREFVTDAALQVEGYQACLPNPDYGMILLTHTVEGCRTTLGVMAASLRVLYDGPDWPERKTGLEACQLHCLNPKDLEECTVDCELAWVRHVLQWLRRHELPPHLRVAGAAERA
jgi:hypothetical protein